MCSGGPSCSRRPGQGCGIMGIPPLGNGGRPFSLGMKRHIDVRAESYGVAAEQAEAVRRCVVDGAAGIATTLVEPEVLKTGSPGSD